ncbi:MULTISPECIES: nucleotidyl transferase AbiEii/AbiGii toxin family protein [unclassified Mesorhizobium]|uniref:nucleotidyl transferase AbiEii/AbiGii toxin family protein n=1 Tax=unclassified Mesorhizobium TaxID=325217 RepID=UPI0019D180B9|nr:MULTISPECIES: nucleotidyl transferase AbiEii/AbiGii toxin family protein [unclassified Mesorhizobium]MCT2580498.1 nucleotidyl transferase AbiEii/AbiGii toxin family protein [Mesorhizobium sp. P13.3]MDF3169440.1 hypothetical protein [Mesorhizobium sp. P16.1]MDF3178898.1 hypothetical protein [Mesorhizobium sp. P17.1]MDF3186355.1 hypothetical protein [Mesorhizobium sp. ICCV3110.1]
MTRKSLRNIGASVRARLRHRAREQKEKGAMLFNLWSETPYRSTGDLDLLGFGDEDPQRLASAFREICALDVEDGRRIQAKHHANGASPARE